jgi:hypothetical protein
MSSPVANNLICGLRRPQLLSPSTGYTEKIQKFSPLVLNRATSQAILLKKKH